MSDTPDIVQRRDDAQFQTDVDSLSKEAEDRRFTFMKKHRDRRFISMTASIIGLFVGAGGFGWFLLMRGDILLAVISMVAAIVLPFYLHFWAEGPIAAYGRDYKNNFLPKMARALGGLKFFASRGISEKMLGMTGVIPPHDSYHSEDCFMGVYKGIKVIFSEARLIVRGRPHEPAFKGVFVLLEVKDQIFKGHTIITADRRLVEHNATTRWKKLKSVPALTDNPEWNKFQIFTDKPENCNNVVGDNLLKELSEASKVFGDSALTAVLFRGKFIFMMIPHKSDMFEASNMYVPVPIQQHALKCKKEIEQILEVIDVFELYQPGKTVAAEPVQSETKSEA